MSAFSNPTRFADPGLQTMMKVGSALRHMEEYLSPGGHEYDRDAFEGLMADPDVSAWMAEGDRLALLPVKR